MSVRCSRRLRGSLPRHGLAVALLVLAALVVGADTGAAQPPVPPPRCAAVPAGPGGLLAPVDAVVSVPFSLPDGPYGAGNRGLEYAIAAGQPVRAVAPGTVSFAGVIAGERYVSVRHDDELVSSYSYLGAIEVAVGDAVGRGQRLGRTSSRFQLGLRRAGLYIDPGPLLGSGRLRPRLVAPGAVPPTC